MRPEKQAGLLANHQKLRVEREKHWLLELLCGTLSTQ